MSHAETVAQSADWASRYVGIPFVDCGRDQHGCDCWGLVRLVLLEQFGIETPAYTGYSTASAREEVNAIVQASLPEWRAVPAGTERGGDVVLLRLTGLPVHVGIVTAPPLMLHTRQGVAACIEDYRRPQWARRVLGFYRFEGTP